MHLFIWIGTSVLAGPSLSRNLRSIALHLASLIDSRVACVLSGNWDRVSRLVRVHQCCRFVLAVILYGSAILLID